MGTSAYISYLTVNKATSRKITPRYVREHTNPTRKRGFPVGLPVLARFGVARFENRGNRLLDGGPASSILFL